MNEAFLARWGPILAAAGATLVTAMAGGLLTDVGPWYKALRKPSWQPPEWAFGPIWTIILSLCAWAAVLGWTHATSPGQKAALVAAYAANYVLNAAWSYFFFFRRRPDLALIEVVPLWLSILVLIGVDGWIVPLAGALVAPYIVWVSIAAYLNLTIVRLNPA